MSQNWICTSYHSVSEAVGCQDNIHSIAVPQEHSMSVTTCSQVQVKWMRAIWYCEILEAFKYEL